MNDEFVKNEILLVCGFFFGDMPQAAALDQTIEIFRQVRCVVAGAF
jgi:hypothetical protein